MYKALRDVRLGIPSENLNLSPSGGSPLQDGPLQDTLFHDFSAILKPIELDRFRSILWYVSSLWAILLDDVGYPRGFPRWRKEGIHCYLCSCGLLKLRKVLCAVPEERRKSE